ncbi:MAG: carbamoyltransferase HypF [Verrucomicrobia bacterium]|nr:carbamoyltransferase HypF [Verrucomicrobiota bacterium]
MKVERAKITVRGAVQGVGFRPHVYRLATELALQGWVINASAGVLIEVEGVSETLRQFLLRLEKEKPPRAELQGVEFSILDPVGYKGFEIRFSDQQGPKTVLILPDVATCADCLKDILEPANRRHGYPFTNCTNCGPRFSILEALPYDRPNTSMRKFIMCPNCTREYHDPRDRRFHAQPNACPRCGPQLEVWAPDETIRGQGYDAFSQAADLVREGHILALKGIGGFQLIVDATSERAVTTLRARKRREEKPFALMYPSLEEAREDCRVSALEERLLLSPESPIVLLERRTAATRLASSLAPRNPALGVMLPYSPLHHLLVRALGRPIVATSGNLSSEPMCTDNREAVARLHGIADAFLVHDRPIVRPVDDSVVRVVRERELVLRRARGYAPLPVQMSAGLPCVLAVGAQSKNTVALSVGSKVFLSQHIGDLETGHGLSAFDQVAADLPRLYEVTPEFIACDLHPDYVSTKYAWKRPESVHLVQHHWAHALACMAENEIEAPALAVVWDGAGFGSDGTIWGGEFLLAEGAVFRRVAHLHPFQLSGGEAAVWQPRRAALGVLFELGGDGAIQDPTLAPVQGLGTVELSLIRRMLAEASSASATTSAGRLFDAVASLVGLRQQVSFEGQAGMELEFAIEQGVHDAYPFEVEEGEPYVVDWRPMIRQVIEDLRADQPLGRIAALFHNTLAQMVLAIAQRVEEEKVVLTGGCFQNRYLTEHCVDMLRSAGFRVYWHQRVPPNDGGIALGQVIAAARFAEQCSSATQKAVA